MALAVKKASGIDEEARRENRAKDHAVFLDFQAFGCVHVAFYLSSDAEDPGVNVTIHFALIVDDHRTFGVDLPFKVGIDPNEAGGHLHFSFNLYTWVEPANPVAGEFRQLMSSGLS